MTPKWRSLNDSPLKRSLRTKTPKFGSLKRKNSGSSGCRNIPKIPQPSYDFRCLPSTFWRLRRRRWRCRPSWGSVPPNQPGIIPTKKKDMEIWYFPRILMGRTSWAKNVSFWEGRFIIHPCWELEILATQLGWLRSRHLGCWGCCHSQGF